VNTPASDGDEDRHDAWIAPFADEADEPPSRLHREPISGRRDRHGTGRIGWRCTRTIARVVRSTRRLLGRG